VYRLPDIYELKLFGVGDPGVPNRERIILRAWDYAPVNLAPYLVTLGWKMPEGGAMPGFDGMCWLGELQVAANQWVFVYTGPGATRSSETSKGEPLYVRHWGRENTLFGSEGVVPLLVQMGGIAVNESPDYVLSGPQLPLGLPQGGLNKLRDLAKLAGLPKKPAGK
jgi:hypothetical protein